jgi:opacity protein-like surface antigen
MKTTFTFLWKYIALILITIAAFAAEIACADNTEITRAGKWDVYLIGQNLSSEQIDYHTNSGLIPIEMDDTFLWGFGFGYHVRENLGWRFEISTGNPIFRGKGPATGTSRQATMRFGAINFDWFITPKRFTPYLTAGVGWQYLYVRTSNVGTTVAYWDPWYGYTVGTSFPSHTESNAVWTVGLGLRWEVSDRFFLRVSGDSNWLHFNNASEWTTQTRYGLALGATY